MMLFAATSDAQTLAVVEKLPNGSFVILIDGIEHRAFNPEQMRALDKRKIELEGCQREKTELDNQIAVLTREKELLKKDVEIANLKAQSFEVDFNRAQEDSKRNYGLFIGERTLRQQATQFVPHGNASGFGGKVLKFLDSGYFQFGIKVATPLATGIRTFTKPCN